MTTSRLSLLLPVLLLAACATSVEVDPREDQPAESAPVDAPEASELAVPSPDSPLLVCNPCLVSASAYPCHHGIPGRGGLCASVQMANGSTCRTGIGTCWSGVCVAPVATCFDPPPASRTICQSDLDCNDGNPCTNDDCPEPGCDACHHAPVVNGLECGLGLTCFSGSCCATP